MNLKNQQPVFVPFEFRAELEQLSKAALMDLVWDAAFQSAGERPDDAIAEIRRRCEIVLSYRAQDRRRASTTPTPAEVQASADRALAAADRLMAIPGQIPGLARAKPTTL